MYIHMYDRPQIKTSQSYNTDGLFGSIFLGFTGRELPAVGSWIFAAACWGFHLYPQNMHVIYR